MTELKIRIDSKGRRYVRYKNKKYILHKSLATNISQKKLLKWVIAHAKYVSKRKPAKKPAKKKPAKKGRKPGVHQTVDKNLAEMARKTLENKRPEDAIAPIAYINAKRAQEGLPELPQTDQVSKDSKREAPKTSADKRLATIPTVKRGAPGGLPSKREAPKYPKHSGLAALALESRNKPEKPQPDEEIEEHGSWQEFTKNAAKRAVKAELAEQRAKQEADEEKRRRLELKKEADTQRAEIAKQKKKYETEIAMQESVIRNNKRRIVTDIIYERYSRDQLIDRVKKLNMDHTAINPSRKGRHTKSREELWADVLIHDPEIGKIIRDETEKAIAADKPKPTEPILKKAEPVQQKPEEFTEPKFHEDKPDPVLEGSGKPEDGLSNIEIDKFMRGEPGYLGCIASDEIISHILPKVQEGQPGNFVMNLDPSSKKGSHWVSCYFTKDSIEYYDSFGDAPTQSFVADMRKVAHKVNPNGFFKLKTNHVARQDPNTSTCGYHAMKFIKDRNAGKSFAEATGYSDHLKDDHVRGEKAVTKFIHHMHGNGFQFLLGDPCKEKTEC